MSKHNGLNIQPAIHTRDILWTENCKHKFNLEYPKAETPQRLRQYKV